MTGSLEGLVAPPPKTSTPGPAQAGTPAKTGSGSRAAGKRKLAASAAGSTAPGALLLSVVNKVHFDRRPECACLACPKELCCQAFFAPQCDHSMVDVTWWLYAVFLYSCSSWNM